MGWILINQDEDDNNRNGYVHNVIFVVTIFKVICTLHNWTINKLGLFNMYRTQSKTFISKQLRLEKESGMLCYQY